MPFMPTDQIFRIDTPLGGDVLLLRGFNGQEGMSQISSFELDLLTEGPPIDFNPIVGQEVTIRVALEDDNERFFNGFISRFAQTRSTAGMIHYRAEMVPWLWFLTRTTNCRIFQHQTIPHIIEQVFMGHDFSDYRFSFDSSYEEHEYCVQYRETDYDFVARLMEQYGINYFFEHEETKHTLVLSDTRNAHQPFSTQPAVSWEPEGSELSDDQVITQLEFEKEIRPGKFSHTDYNFKTPNANLAAEESSMFQIGGNAQYEIYDYPGGYAKQADGATLAKIRMQEEDALHYSISGRSTCRAFNSGSTFDLVDFQPDDLNQSYVLTEIEHAGLIEETKTSDGTVSMSGKYSNVFTCIPHDLPFRPEQVTPKPVVQGPQTAVIVGPAGQEIYCDEDGRVKVQFHWDREGQKDERSSVWVRVSQLWAGKGWGAMFLPRIGQEVIVEFLEGDPDQPIITGRVYNADQTVPYSLPAEKTKSTIKSNSSDGGGNSNELRFEDKAGFEEIYLHSAKDWTIAIDNDKEETIAHNQTQNIGNDHTRSVRKNENVSIGKNRTTNVRVDQRESVGSNKSMRVGANDSESIGANKTVKVRNNHSEAIGGNETVTVGKASVHTIRAAKALSVGGAYQVSVGAAMNETIGGLKTEEIGKAKTVVVGASSSETVGANKTINVGANISETAGKTISLSAGKNVTINAGDSLAAVVGKDATVSAGKNITLTAKGDVTIKNDKSSITLKKNGDIIIKGQTIQVDAQKGINLKTKGNLIQKAKKILQTQTGDRIRRARS